MPRIRQVNRKLGNGRKAGVDSFVLSFVLLYPSFFFLIFSLLLSWTFRRAKARSPDRFWKSLRTSKQLAKPGRSRAAPVQRLRAGSPLWRNWRGVIVRVLER
jgi:hypothetical protein